MHKFLEHYIQDWPMILQTRTKESHGQKVESVLHLLKNTLVRSYVILSGSVRSTDLVVYKRSQTLLTSSRPTVRKRKNGSRIIIFRSQHMPWHTTMFTTQKSSKELSWYARLTYIIKNSKWG